MIFLHKRGSGGCGGDSHASSYLETTQHILHHKICIKVDTACTFGLFLLYVNVILFVQGICNSKSEVCSLPPQYINKGFLIHHFNRTQTFLHQH